ncbi:hypothetical protein [Pseudomonas aeruginosa]|uniref:hypothetical protein n=1 Tax=Pseudomonas aeruginosa TaxID=287 RepID=UPI000B5A89E8|nr:hypothetical protein [Pseudomonas aeruginosa]ELN4741112.1 hypothetical protein [Escherichia coli]ASJ88590.1 hypothetical protein PSA83_06464 [Pseudomonas aeruginosa]MBO8337001.1 hypothetical protein [Pseudomonas aeruginosa]HDV6122898.1 hypothetical protein [Pseudomonas aeruginosa]HDV6143776.1 hypothetical protein [Pseudomonas aeruginosa]
MNPSTLQALRAKLDLLPSVDFRHGELDVDKPVILAGDEAIFRCRTNDLGKAYAEFLVEAMPLVVEMLGKDSFEPCLALPVQAAEPGSDVEALVRSKIEVALSLQPELSARLPIWSKMVYAAVSPYIQPGAAVVAEQSAPAAPKQLDAAQVASIRADAVGDFAVWLGEWLAETGRGQIADETLEMAISQWGGEHNA